MCCNRSGGGRLLENIPINDRIYIDETGVEDEMLRDHGYSLKGTRVKGEVTAIKHNRTSVIGSARKIG